MKIKEVTFLRSVAINADKIFLDNKKEVIFVGRSNVGKSSLMNALFQKKDLVKTSSRPWKTKLANIFLVNKKYNFTDLPGYWFAKLWKEIREHLDALISWYVEEREEFVSRVVIVLDSKIWPQQTDIDMYEYLQDLEVPMYIVLSKTDRLNASEIQKSINHTKWLMPWHKIFTLSSRKNVWIKELWKELSNGLA